jgi:hypothetical protein
LTASQPAAAAAKKMSLGNKAFPASGIWPSPAGIVTAPCRAIARDSIVAQNPTTRVFALATRTFPSEADMYTPAISEGCHPARLLLVERLGEADEWGIQRHFLHLTWTLSTYRHGSCLVDEVFLLPSDEERLKLRLTQMGSSTLEEAQGWWGDVEITYTYYDYEPTAHIAGVIRPPEELDAQP